MDLSPALQKDCPCNNAGEASVLFCRKKHELESSDQAENSCDFETSTSGV